MKNYNKAGQKPSVARKTYLQMLEDEEERRRRERQQGTGLTNLAGAYMPDGSNSAGSMPGLANLSDTYRPTGAASGVSSPAKTTQPKTANTFYTNAPNSGTIVPRFGSIAAYNRAIEEGNKKLDELAHRQFQAMLRNDVSGMNALEKQYKDTKKHLDSLKAELGEVMGAGIHGKKGNQLTGSGWFGQKMDELSADSTAAKQTKLGDETDKKIVINSGGGYADFFREQRGEGRSETGQSWGGGGYADFFRELREGEKGGTDGSWGDGEKSNQRDRKDINIVRWDKNGTALYSPELAKKIESLDKEYVKNALQVVSSFGSILYPAAASMLNEAFNGEGKDKDFGEDAIVSKILKNDNYFIETLANEFDPALVGQDGGYDNNGKTITLSFKGQNSDLFYALGHATAKIVGARRNGDTWHLTVKVSDRYDFDEWIDSAEMVSGSYLNNIGLAGQYYGIIKPFNFSITVPIDIPAK